MDASMVGGRGECERCPIETQDIVFNRTSSVNIHTNTTSKISLT